MIGNALHELELLFLIIRSTWTIRRILENHVGPQVMMPSNSNHIRSNTLIILAISHYSYSYSTPLFFPFFFSTPLLHPQPLSLHLAQDK